MINWAIMKETEGSTTKRDICQGPVKGGISG